MFYRFVTLLSCCIFVFIASYVLLNTQYFYGFLKGSVTINRQYIGIPKRGENNIFFVEPSCVLDAAPDQVGLVLVNGRRACALESAARANPDASVYLLHTCPVTSKALGNSEEHIHQLLLYPNLYVWPVNSSIFFQGTPLEGLFRSGSLRNSAWPVVHGSDVLRLLTAWKYGGTFLDLNLIVRRSFDGLPKNFAAIESSYLGNGAFNFGVDKVAVEKVMTCLREINNYYNTTIRKQNGPLLFTRIMEQLCQHIDYSATTVQDCNEFNVLPRNYFHPLQFDKEEAIFEDKETNQIMISITSSYGVHLRNLGSADRRINLTIKSPFALMTREFCPKVHAVIGAEF